MRFILLAILVGAGLGQQVRERLGLLDPAALAEVFGEPPSTIATTTEPRTTVTTTRPTVRTTRPTVRTTRPTVRTTRPTVRTTRPTVRTTRPTVRTTRPTIRTTRPTIRTTGPTIRTTRPTIRTTRPTVRTTRPTIRTTRPTIRTSRPTVRSTRPPVRTTRPPSRPSQSSGNIEQFGKLVDGPANQFDNSIETHSGVQPPQIANIQVVPTESSEIPSGKTSVSVPVVPDGVPRGDRPALVSVDTSLGSHCANYSSLGYSCVEYYQCRDGHIITDGLGLIDIRFGPSATSDSAVLDPANSKCPGMLEVCCKDPDFSPPPPAPRHIAKCGVRNNNGLYANIQNSGKEVTQFGEWPHMCAILELVQLDNGYGGQETVQQFKCGGSLIAPGILLTAAHCVPEKKADNLVVRCGEWDTRSNDEVLPFQERRVSEIVVHPGYIHQAGNLHNDFGLLFLAEDMELAANVDTICLPELGELVDRERCVTMGWGKDRFGDVGQYQAVLQQVELPIVARDTCQQVLRDARLGPKFFLDESFTCAGGARGRDACTGDGGSSLVCPSLSRAGAYVQAGLVSWGLGCGQEGVPGVYADVGGQGGSCWIDYEVSCRLGLSGSYFGRSDCRGWLEGMRTHRFLGRYFQSKCPGAYSNIPYSGQAPTPAY